MTRLFDDEQSSSLITSMMNPESNATKFIEQGEDILEKFCIKDDELEGIFDMIAEEYPDL